MDTRDGRIMPMDQVAAMPALDRPFIREMVLEPTPGQRLMGRVGRDDPCPCGSGRKFKLCCLVKPGASPSPPPARPVASGMTMVTIGPEEVLASVRAMDAGQRRELAGLLGVEARHPLLYLPTDAGGFLQPGYPGREPTPG